MLDRGSVFGKEWGNVGFKVFVLKPGEDFISSVNLCEDFCLEGVDLFLFCCNVCCGVSKSFEISMPFRGAEEVDVLMLIWASQELEEIVDGEGFMREYSRINSWEPGFRGSFRLG